MSYLIPRAGLDGVGLDFRVVYNKGGGDPVSSFVQNTIGSVTDAVDTGLSSAADVVNPVLDSVGLKDVRQGLTDTWHDVAPIAGTVAKFTPLAPLAYSYDAYDAGRRYGDTGDLGDLALAGANAGLAAYGMPGTSQTGFMNGNPTGGLDSVFDMGGAGSSIGPATGTEMGPGVQSSGAETFAINQPSVVESSLSASAPAATDTGSWFSNATGQAPAPVETPTPAYTAAGTGPQVPVNTGSDWSNYTIKGLTNKTGLGDMGNGMQQYGKMKALGNLYGAYQANQRQGQLNDLYNQQKGYYDQAMGNYNTLNSQIQNLQSNPTEYFNSPEWQSQNAMFMANLARKDAAQGRRSQYGARAQQMQGNFLQGLNQKTQALTQARGSMPNNQGLAQMMAAKAANENAVGQNLAGAAMNYFAPQMSFLGDIFGRG